MRRRLNFGMAVLRRSFDAGGWPRFESPRERGDDRLVRDPRCLQESPPPPGLRPAGSTAPARMIRRGAPAQTPGSYVRSMPLKKAIGRECRSFSNGCRTSNTYYAANAKTPLRSARMPLPRTALRRPSRRRIMPRSCGACPEEQPRRSFSSSLTGRQLSLLWMTKRGQSTAQTIICGANAWRHEVDFRNLFSQALEETRAATGTTRHSLITFAEPRLRLPRSRIEGSQVNRGQA